MKRVFINTLIITSLVFMIASCKQTPKDPTAAAMDKITNLIAERYSMGKDEKAPGCAIVIQKGDSILLEKYIGYADLFFEQKISSLTHFNIASCSKQFTAAAILRLAEEGKIDINASIYDISPEINKYLPKKEKPFTDITPALLMAHSSGIPDARPRDNRDFVLHATDMQSIEYLKDLDSLNFEPGTKYEYINPTFQLLYLFIENITGESFEKYMYSTCFYPAKMYNTKYFSPNTSIINMAHGYIPDPEKDKAWKEYDYGEENFFGTKADGGIYASALEMAHWITALRDNKVITELSKSKMWTPTTLVYGSELCDYQNRPNTFYGLGWFIEQQPDYPLKVYHTGDNGGFQAYEGYFPEADVAVIILENRNDKPRWELVEKIDAILKDAGLLDAPKAAEN